MHDFRIYVKNWNEDFSFSLSILHALRGKIVWTYEFLGQGLLDDPCTFRKMGVKSKKLVKIQYFWKDRYRSYSCSINIWWALVEKNGELPYETSWL